MRIPALVRAVLTWQAIRYAGTHNYSKRIGGAADPYLFRWHWHRGRESAVFIHLFKRSDDDRALHDHPWASCSILLKGSYFEHTRDGLFLRRPGEIVFRRATDAHRIELLRDLTTGRPQEVWTLFVVGKRVREWGFLCPQGWRHWREFTAGPGGETVGKGCD